MSARRSSSMIGLALGPLLLAVTSCSGGGASPTDGGTGPEGGGLAEGCPTVREDLISDFRNDNSLWAADGRQGGWYVYGDDPPPTGTFDPPKIDNSPYPIDRTTGNDSCSGKGSFRVRGMGWTEFGAALGTDFKPRMPAGPGADGGMGVKQVYNASKYKGIAFWAKGATPIRFVSVKFLDPYTDRDSPIPMADWCLYTPGSAYNCSPYIVKFGYGYGTPPAGADGGNAAGDAGADAGVVPEFEDYPAYKDYKIDVTWKRFEVLFADTKQDRNNGGQKSPGDKLDTTQLMGMAIQINADYTTTPQTANNFEIWIDDVTFIK